MPSAKSARVSERRRSRNAPLRSRIKTFIVRARQLISENEIGQAERAVKIAIVALDKAAQKGSIHRRNASRHKSRLMKHLHEAKINSD